MGSEMCIRDRFGCGYHQSVDQSFGRIRRVLSVVRDLQRYLGRAQRGPQRLVVHGAEASDRNRCRDLDWCLTGGNVGAQFFDRVRQYSGSGFGAAARGLAEFSRSRFDVFADAVSVLSTLLVLPGDGCEIP